MSQVDKNDIKLRVLNGMNSTQQRCRLRQPPARKNKKKHRILIFERCSMHLNECVWFMSFVDHDRMENFYL